MSRLREAVHVACSKSDDMRTQRDLAEYLGITEGQMSRILSNRKRRLTGGQIERLSKFLELSTDDLLQLLAQDESSAVEGKSVETMRREMSQMKKEQEELSYQIQNIYKRLDEVKAAVKEKDAVLRERNSKDVGGNI